MLQGMVDEKGKGKIPIIGVDDRTITLIPFSYPA
jgi:hypothetical protein